MRARLDQALLDLRLAGEQLALANEKIARLERENADLRHQVFGRKSERQKEARASPPATPSALPPPTAADSPTPASGHGRAPLPESLPRISLPAIDPPESEQRCPDCGGDCVPFASDVTEILDLNPAALRALVETRRRWSCPNCQTFVTSAEPARPIPRARPSANLLAFVVTSKFSDHLPLNRLEGIFARQGVEIARSTLADWCRETARKRLKYVVEEIEKDVLANPVVGLDETGIGVRDKSAPGNIRRGRLWLYRGAPGDVVLKHTATKGGEHPAKILENFVGTVQADAANTFDRLFRDERRTEAGCSAHARRKFVKVESLPEAQLVIEKYRQLYVVEREAKDRGLDSEARRRLRQERSKPIVAELYAYLRSLKPPAGSQLESAVNYALAHEAALCRFLDDGLLEIDNNNVERLLRLVAIGRRNYLFLGSPKAADDAAILYSVVASCRDLGIDPFAYLRDVLERLPLTPRSQVAELTPRRWHQARQDRT